VDNFAGSYTNVVGLPVEETRGLLAELGVPVSEPAGP
jgi:predicted house-cleaning NTP pyrophosphatase (Maf/HAM1 superfamily)